MSRKTGGHAHTGYVIAFAVCALLFASSVAATDWCAGRVTDNQPKVVEKLVKPEPLQSYIDPAFGTQVTRITAAPAGTARRTLYNTIQPWNADESLLILYHTGGPDAGHHLYDGRTYRHLRALNFSAEDIEGIYWHPTDPAVLFFVQRRPRNDELVGNLVRYDVRDRSRSQLADLNSLCGHDPARTGQMATGGSDIQGLGGDLIGLRCQHDRVTGEPRDITFTVNVYTGEISPSVTLDPAEPQGDNLFGFLPSIAAAPFPSGQHVLVQNTVYDREMNYKYRLDSTFSRYRQRDGRTVEVPKLEHSTIGRMPDGGDALFTPQYNATEFGCGADSDYGRGALVAYDIPGRQCHVIVGRSTGWDYPLKGVHLSAVSANNPGWVSMTSVGYGHFDYLHNGKPAPALFSELSLSYADPDNPKTCRLAHTRTLGKSARNVGAYRSAYFGEPHAVMSPSGSRILFNSDWYDSGSVDTYVVSLGAPVAETHSTPAQTAPAATVAQSDTRPPALPSAPSTTSDEPSQAMAPVQETDPEIEQAAAPMADPESAPQSTEQVSEPDEGQADDSLAHGNGDGDGNGNGESQTQTDMDSDSPAPSASETGSDSAIQAAIGYVFARTDKQELRWITHNANGKIGSIWISPACAAALGGARRSGNWRELMAVAPALDTVKNPCLPDASVLEQGYVFARTDKDELRWVASNEQGEQASVWISAACAASLGGPTESGDWRELMQRAPALDTIRSPCL